MRNAIAPSRRFCGNVVVTFLVGSVVAWSLSRSAWSAVRSARFNSRGSDGAMIGRRDDDAVADAVLEPKVAPALTPPPRKRAALERRYDGDTARRFVAREGTEPEEYFLGSGCEETNASEASTGFESDGRYEYDAKRDVKHVVDMIRSANATREPIKASFFCPGVLPQDLYNDMLRHWPVRGMLQRDSRANAGQVGRQDADKRYKCSAFDILKLKENKKFPALTKAKMVWQRATKVLYHPSVKLALFVRFTFTYDSSQY